jgi:ubiquinone/menaquinone biosynthesis C-methylase UbiE
MSEQIYKQKEKIFDRWAPNYDFLFTTIFYQALHKRLLEYLELPETANVLDLGCGTGRLLNRLAAKFPHLKGTGLDLSSIMLRQARQTNQHHDRLIFIRGNAEALPFAENQFDAVFNSISFLHYPNPQQVVSEVSRVLNKEGRYHLIDYLGGDIFSPKLKSFVPISFYSFEQREELGRNAGLECLGHHYLLGSIALTIFRK